MGENNKILYISNLKQNTEKKWLESCLRKETKNFIRLMTLGNAPRNSTKWALASFRTHNAANEALMDLRNKPWGPLDAPICVEFKKRKKSTSKTNHANPNVDKIKPNDLLPKEGASVTTSTSKNDVLDSFPALQRFLKINDDTEPPHTASISTAESKINTEEQQPSESKPSRCLLITGRGGEALNQDRLTDYVQRALPEGYVCQFHDDGKSAIIEYGHVYQAERAYGLLGDKPLSINGGPVTINYITTPEPLLSKCNNTVRTSEKSSDEFHAVKTEERIEECKMMGSPEDENSLNVTSAQMRKQNRKRKKTTSTIADGTKSNPTNSNVKVADEQYLHSHDSDQNFTPPSREADDDGDPDKSQTHNSTPVQDSTMDKSVPNDTTDKQKILKLKCKDKNLNRIDFETLLKTNQISYVNIDVRHLGDQEYGSIATIEFSVHKDALAAESKIRRCKIGDIMNIEITSRKNNRRRNRRRNRRSNRELDRALSNPASAFATDELENMDTEKYSHAPTDADDSDQPQNIDKISVETHEEAAEAQDSYTSVLVKNIDKSIKEEHIQDFLNENDIDTRGLSFFKSSRKGGSYAIVRFQYPEEAEHARITLAEQPLGQLGEKLQVTLLARPPKELTKKARPLQSRKANGIVDTVPNSNDDDEINENIKSDTTTANATKIPKLKPPSPNDVIIEDLPRYIRESDIAQAVWECPADGFIDCRLTGNRAVLEFKSQECAMTAVAELHFMRVKGHALNAQLSVQNPDFEAVMSRKQHDVLVACIKAMEKSINTEMNAKMNQLAFEIQEIDTNCQLFQEYENNETTKDLLEHKLDEWQGFHDEFDRTAQQMSEELDLLNSENTKGKQGTLSRLANLSRLLERERRRTQNPLPIYGYKTHIRGMITDTSTRACVIQAETGSGKSTQVPQYLIESMQSDDSYGSVRGVICTQPRRIAAVSLAKRVAEEYGCQEGHEVGYMAGNRKRVSKTTLVTFMTDRALLNYCLADAHYLDDYKYVIIDEAHERSVDTDILIAMLKKKQLQHGITIIIMSATIDIDQFSAYFGGCPVIDIPGRTYPVDVEWCKEVAHGENTGSEDYVTNAVQKCCDIHDEGDVRGDILVFLTSQNEIERACRDLKGFLLPDVDDRVVEILPLHGKLQSEDQFKVFRQTRDGQRKIVFATNIAETSVTIPGVKYVVDTGMVKELQYDAQRNMSLLKVTTISQASAEQRKGRAGRTGPGKCFRLYSKTEYDDMEPTMKPEILRVHLGMAVIKLLEMGVKDVEDFDFVDSPDTGAIKQAMKSLMLLGAVNHADTSLTKVGYKMAKLPLEPRLAKLILEGATRGVLKDAVVMAALISAPGNVYYQGGSGAERNQADQLKLRFCVEDGDVITLLAIYKEWFGNKGDKARNKWCKQNSMNAKTLRMVQQNVQELEEIIRHSKIKEDASWKMEDVATVNMPRDVRQHIDHKRAANEDKQNTAESNDTSSCHGSASPPPAPGNDTKPYPCSGTCDEVHAGNDSDVKSTAENVNTQYADSSRSTSANAQVRNHGNSTTDVTCYTLDDDVINHENSTTSDLKHTVNMQNDVAWRDDPVDRSGAHADIHPKTETGYLDATATVDRLQPRNDFCGKIRSTYIDKDNSGVLANNAMMYLTDSKDIKNDLLPGSIHKTDNDKTERQEAKNDDFFDVVADDLVTQKVLQDQSIGSEITDTFELDNRLDGTDVSESRPSDSSTFEEAAQKGDIVTVKGNTSEGDLDQDSKESPIADVKPRPQANSDPNEILRKVLLSAYFENLSVFTGHNRVGYTVATQLKTAVFHPSSALAALNAKPEWVVYGEFRRTSNDFLCVVTPIDINWIDEVVPVEFSRHLDLDKLKACAMAEEKVESVGTATMKVLSRRRFESVRQLEDSIARETRVPCIIEVNLEYGYLVVFIAIHSKNLAVSMVKKSLEDIKKEALCEQIELPVGSFGNIRHVVMSGGETIFVLNEDEYRTVELSGLCEDVSEEVLLQRLQIIGYENEDVVDLYKFPKHTAAAKQGKWGKVTFASPAKARQAVASEFCITDYDSVEVLPVYPDIRNRNHKNNSHSTINTQIVVKWFTEPSKGYAIVECQCNDDARYVIENMNGEQLGDKYIRCRPGNRDDRSVYIGNLDTDITEEGLEEVIFSTVDVEPNRVIIPRDRTQSTATHSDAAYKRELRQIFRSVSDQIVEINVLPARSAKRKAFITFQPNMVPAKRQRLNRVMIHQMYRSALSHVVYCMEIAVTCAIYCAAPVFQVVEGSVRRRIQSSECTVNIEKTKKEPPDERIQISSDNFDQVAALEEKLRILLRGDEMKATTLVDRDVSPVWMDRALIRLAEKHLVNILMMTSNRAHAAIDTRRQIITLYGRESGRKSLSTRLREYFTVAATTMFREVDVSSRSSGQKGLGMRALVRQYGTWLEKLTEESGVDNITVDLKRGLLLVDGPEEAFKKLVSRVDDCLKELTISPNGVEEQTDNECGVCFCPPLDAGSKPYRLASCGHFFCLACLKEHLKQSSISKKYPIACPGCEESIMLCDIKIICPVEDERQKVFQAGLDSHVSQNPAGDIQFCTGPDCSMVYRRNKNGGTRECAECGIKMCKGCGEKPHRHNMSCAEFNISRKADDSVEKWMKESGVDAKKCPNCRTVIEKIEGCDRMHCEKCLKHICWKCLKFYNAAEECYRHLSLRHGGAFDLPPDIVNEIRHAQQMPIHANGLPAIDAHGIRPVPEFRRREAAVAEAARLRVPAARPRVVHPQVRAAHPPIAAAYPQVAAARPPVAAAARPPAEEVVRRPQAARYPAAAENVNAEQNQKAERKCTIL